MAQQYLFLDNSDEVRQALANALPSAFEEIGLQAEGYAKLELGRKHAVDTGNLRNSITHTVDGDTAYIGTNVEYAPYVELGTVKMAARPYLKPAAADHKDQYRQIISDKINEALQ